MLTMIDSEPMARMMRVSANKGNLQLAIECRGVENSSERGSTDKAVCQTVQEGQIQVGAWTADRSGKEPRGR
jgi:hypothetical protein